MEKGSQKLLIIVGSTRPGRIGKAVADWFYDQTKSQSEMQFEIVDLAEWNLPLLNEPVPPKAHMYQHDHTQRWSAKIVGADGYVIVTPEYNHGYPAGLKNALDYLYHEWADKPVAFVSYGWGGGQLAVKQLHQVVEELKMRSVEEQVAIFFRPNMFDEHHSLIDTAITLAHYETDALKAMQALSDAFTKGKVYETVI